MDSVVFVPWGMKVVFVRWRLMNALVTLVFRFVVVDYGDEGVAGEGRGEGAVVRN